MIPSGKGWEVAITRQVIIPLEEYEQLRVVVQEAAKAIITAVHPSVVDSSEMRLPNWLGELHRAVRDYRAVVSE